MLVPAFPEPCVAVAVTAALVVLCDVELAVWLDELSDDVATELTTEETVGIDVADAGPGLPRAERLLLPFADSRDAGNVASGVAVRGTSKIAQS